MKRIVARLLRAIASELELPPRSRLQMQIEEQAKVIKELRERKPLVVRDHLDSISGEQYEAIVSKVLAAPSIAEARAILRNRGRADLSVTFPRRS